MNCCLECQAPSRIASLSAAQILRTDMERNRSRDITRAAEKIVCNLSWGKEGPPWADGKDGRPTPRRDREDAANAVRLAWGEKAVDELRAEVKTRRNPNVRGGAQMSDVAKQG